MNIGFYEFKLLPISLMAEILWNEGEFIASNLDNPPRSNLYALCGFYVEVVVKGQVQEIAEIIPFRQGERLDKFAESVTLGLRVK